MRDLVLGAVFTIFDRVLPVRDDFWCFCTWEDYPHTLDNPRAVFEEVKDDPSVYKIVLQKDTSEPVREGVNVTSVPAESLRGVYYLARSRVVLIGYALLGMSSYSHLLASSRHAVIQLWHGIPLKRIGHLFPGEDFWGKETDRYAATVCSSDRDREVMARAFAPIPRSRVWLTGLPRNDLLLKDEKLLPADYREHLGGVDRKLDGRRLVLYAPTWRTDPESLYVFSESETRELERLLSRHDAVLGIRGHPNVRGEDAYAAPSDTERIFFLNDVPDPSVLLRRTSVLVTDYSSMYIDFLLLDRPILHFAYDLEDYRTERGFLYDPDIAFGGPSVGTFDALCDRLAEALADPSLHAKERQRARGLFHTHGDRAASEVSKRILRLVGADVGAAEGKAMPQARVGATVQREEGAQR